MFSILNERLASIQLVHSSFLGGPSDLVGQDDLEKQKGQDGLAITQGDSDRSHCLQEQV